MLRVFSSHGRRVPAWIILGATLLLIPLLANESQGWLSERSASTQFDLEFSPAGGYYGDDILVVIDTSHPDAMVRFTLDGRLPDARTGNEYIQPLHLSTAEPGVTVLRARVVLPSGQLGPVHAVSYFVGLEATLPLLSLIIAPEDLWDPQQGIFAHPIARGPEWERPVDVTFVDEDRQSGFFLAAGVRIHGQISRTYDKKPLRLYFRQEYGNSRLVYPVFGDEGLQSFKRLVLDMGGQDSSQQRNNWTLIRNQLAADLAQEIGGIAPHGRPVLLFLNGQPWGIYQLRERIDRFFLEEHYGTGAADLLDSPELIEHNVISEGDRQHWDALMQFIETHDLADPDNYAYIQTQVDIDNFVDYLILQIYSVNFDWPQHNVNQFRPRSQGGRWSWLFWDSHLTFAQGYRSQPDHPRIAGVLRSEHPDTEGRDTLLIRKLLENPEFFNRFLTRAADLLNTTFLPDSVIARIDSLAAVLEPDISYEIGRWSSEEDWETNLASVRDFARLRPEFMRQNFVRWLGLKGVSEIQLMAPPVGSGTVAVNDILLDRLPWQGTYFRDSTIRVTAVPEPGYRFVAWEGVSEQLTRKAEIEITIDETQAIMPRFEAVADELPRPGDVIFANVVADGEREIEGDWFELLVIRSGGIDLRGWRVTDNDTKIAMDEGSLILPNHPALAEVPRDTRILIIATQTRANDRRFPEDRLEKGSGRIVLYVGNDSLNTGTDPWFNLGPNDNLVLLAPGSEEEFADDRGIAFASVSPSTSAVTTASFGILADGVRAAP
jgi:hypothetical protein